jgi:hypothetical protein
MEENMERQRESEREHQRERDRLELLQHQTARTPTAIPSSKTSGDVCDGVAAMTIEHETTTAFTIPSTAATGVLPSTSVIIDHDHDDEVPPSPHYDY